MGELQSLLARCAGHVLEVVDTDVLVHHLDHALPPQPAGLDVVRLGPQDDWRSVLPRRQWRYVAPFYARGDVGHLAVRSGELVGWVWLSRVSHRDPWSGLRVRLAPDEAYAYALWTAPDARAVGTGRTLMLAVLAALGADPGVSRVYGWVDRRNRASQVLLRMLGFQDVQHVQRVHVLRRFGWLRDGSDSPAYGPLSTDGRHAAPLPSRW